MLSPFSGQCDALFLDLVFRMANAGRVGDGERVACQVQRHLSIGHEADVECDRSVSRSRSACPLSLCVAGKRTSITSRVVPGIEDTIAALRRASRFSRLLFPALGGPGEADCSQRAI